MRKMIVAAVITAILAGSLAGCGAGQTQEPASQDAAQSETGQEQQALEQQTSEEQESEQQAETDAAQEETSQEQSLGVRPGYKLRSHSRMEEKDGTLIASGSYDTVSLTEETIIENIYLNTAIEQLRTLFLSRERMRKNLLPEIWKGRSCRSGAISRS